MIHFNTEQIKDLDKIKRLNLINSLSGIKSANLIGTQSNNGINNLAIFSSVIHLGSNPPLLGFILRPKGDVPRNTYSNIIENGFYTINNIQEEDYKKAHYTSAKFKANESEFEKCSLEEEFKFGFKAPFVKNSSIKIGMQFREEIPIPINGTSLIIGEIKEIIIQENGLSESGHLDLEKLNTVGISGLNSYYNLLIKETLPYARIEELPEF